MRLGIAKGMRNPKVIMHIIQKGILNKKQHDLVWFEVVMISFRARNDKRMLTVKKTNENQGVDTKEAYVNFQDS